MSGAEAQTRIASQRLETCKKILSNVEAFKVCEICEGVCYAAALICPACHGYRFDCSPEGVALHTKRIGSRPLPETWPVLPRHLKT